MKDKNILESVLLGVDQRIKKDFYLLENDLSERSITHRLAIHLQELFSEYDIDCEYNGALENQFERKKIRTTRQTLKKWNLLKDSDGELEDVTRTVNPDIIIHKRGENKNNLCIIEVKKSSSRVLPIYDEIKHESYTSAQFGNALNYQLGIFIELAVRNNAAEPFSLHIYKNGKEINRES